MLSTLADNAVDKTIFVFTCCWVPLRCSTSPDTPAGDPGLIFSTCFHVCSSLKQQHEYVKIHRAVDSAKIFTTRMTIWNNNILDDKCESKTVVSSENYSSGPNAHFMFYTIIFWLTLLFSKDTGHENVPEKAHSKLKIGKYYVVALGCQKTILNMT